MLLAKQVKYVKEMKEEGSLKGKHADVLFEMIEEDLQNLDKHKYQVFKENVQRVFTNRMSVIQSKNSTVDRETSTEKDRNTVSGDEVPRYTIRRSDLSVIDEEANRNHTTMFGQSDLSIHDNTERLNTNGDVSTNHSFSVGGTTDRDSDL